MCGYVEDSERANAKPSNVNSSYETEPAFDASSLGAEQRDETPKAARSPPSKEMKGLFDPHQLSGIG